ncbi:MAG: YdgA family protein [Gammaproteobacteria bacterium]|nr:YdgA family protein [Gammaproteobacteria bacterium]
MKKGVIAVILILAVLVILSPAIVGRLAEQSVDENVNWAAQESGELVVTSTSFDRGWFSSEGEHLIELGEGGLHATLADFGIDPEDAPALVIKTHIDHGLIPVSSMSREKGSLTPGLGSAVSTLSIRSDSGESFDIPGTVYSEVGIAGGVTSNYVLEAGEQALDDGSISWDDANIDFAADPKNGHVTFDGKFGEITAADNFISTSIESLEFSGEHTQTPYGFGVGNVEIEMGPLILDNSDGGPPGGITGMSLVASSALDGERLNADTKMTMGISEIPMIGAISLIADVAIEDANGPALARLNEKLEQLPASQDPSAIMSHGEEELKDLLASGLTFSFNQLDVEMPTGTLESKMLIEVAETDRDTFEWTTLLMKTTASMDVRIPGGLMDMAMAMNPQAAQMAIATGYLRKDGDDYVMEARYKKGVATINGAPMAIPMGAFQ